MTRQQLADDLRAMVMDDPVPFTFDGAIYMGTWSGPARAKTLEIGGYNPDADASLAIPLIDRYGNPTFAERPGVKSLVTIRGHVYRVERTETDPQESCIQLDLVTNAV